MRWLLSAIGGLSLGAATLHAQPAGAEKPRLQLTSGDFVTGELADSHDANLLCWSCDALSEPLQFPLSVVSAAHFQKHGEPNADEGYAVELSGGDVLFGELVGMSAETMAIRSKRFGDLSIDRRQVRRLARRNSDSHIEYFGPNGLAGWVAGEQGENHWTDAAGQLKAEQRGSLLLADCPIPARVCIEVELSWRKKADFAFYVGAGGVDLPAIVDRLGAILPGADRRAARPAEDAPAGLFGLETWDQSLVLVREGSEDADLAQVLAISEGAGRVHLRIFYDQPRGRVAVYSIDGRLLAEVEVADQQTQSRSGIRLVNKAGDLCLEHLVVSRWSGAPPVAVEPNRSFLQRADGTVAYADAIVFDGEEFEASQPEGETVRVAADQIDGVVLPSTEPLAGANVRLALIDGTHLSGDLLKVEQGRLFLRRAGIETPLEFPLAELRLLASIGEPTTAAPPGRLGRFEADGCRLQGVLDDSASSETGSCLRWRPQGSKVSSPIKHGTTGAIIYRNPPPPDNAQARRRAAQIERQQIQEHVQARRQLALRFGGVEVGGRVRSTDRQPTPKSGSQLLWLRGGDRLPCKLTAIDDRGITFETPIVAATFLPHEAVQAWERFAGQPPRDIDEQKRQRLLTLPRMQRDNPPTHLVESHNGDFLRGRLETLNDQSVVVAIRLEPKTLPTNQITRIIWLASDDEVKDGKATNATAADPPLEDAEAALAPHEKLDETAADVASATRLQAVRRDGVRLTFAPQRVADGAIHGESESLGACQVAVDQVDQLYLGEAIDVAARDLLYHEWRLHPAADPRFAEEAGAPTPDAGRDAGLVGKPAPDFRLALLAGGKFELSKTRGQTVVLDFWASWCGPCMQSMPQLDELAEEFADQEVRFVAVNLQEDRQTAADALERLDVSPEVALDVDGAAAEKFAVSAIPQTVVIDRAGNVAAVLIGGGPDFSDRLREAIVAAAGEAAPGVESDAPPTANEP